jgi:hypothetical protein
VSDKSEKRIEMIRLLQALQQSNEAPGDTILRALRELVSKNERLTNIEQTAADLAKWREHCECTDDHQAHAECDGSVCVGQQKAIRAALAKSETQYEN